MATNLLRQLAGHARTMVRRVYTAHALIKRTRAARKQQVIRDQQHAAQTHQRQVKAKIRGVQRTTRSVTKGNRTQRAQQLRQLRANPTTRMQLRRRAQFYTI